MFYLKYRPQSIGELDSPQTREQVTAILKAKELPHAFLFTGPRGTGKTSTARIIAKAVNCPNAAPEPCNRCPVCHSVTRGENLDILEIDAASNRGIDEIRDLREKIKLAPTELKYKVFIIDEVHMLTHESFNALLKTLEEPPKHALFILATTNPEKIPETIVSRCLELNFKKSGQLELLSALKRAVNREKISLNEETLKYIAKTADGIPREAHKILEQLVNNFGQKFSREDAEKYFSQTRSDTLAVNEFLETLLKKDAGKSLSLFAVFLERGGTPKIFIEQILKILRVVLLSSSGLEIEEVVSLDVKSQDLFRLIDLFNRAGVEIKTAVIPQLPIELLVVEFCEKESSLKKPDEVEIPAKIPPPGKNSAEPNPPLDQITQNWTQILKAVKPHNHSVEAFLRACRPCEIKNGELVISVAYKFHKERLENDKYLRLVESVISEIIDSSVRVKYRLTEKPNSAKAAESFENISGALPDEDIVKAAEEIFGAVVE